MTLLIPVYAKPEYVSEMLDSIINQTNQPEEVIFIDDRHSEETTSLLRSRIDDFKTDVKLIVNEKNIGISESTGLGVDLAESDYIGFLDSDDILMPNAISRFRKFSKSETCLDIYSSDYKTFSKNITSTQAIKPLRARILSDMYLQESDWARSLIFENTVSHFRVVSKKLAQSYKWNSIDDGVQDLLLNYCVNQDSKVFLDSCVTYAHRIHSSQATNSLLIQARAAKQLNSGRQKYITKIYGRTPDLINLKKFSFSGSFFAVLTNIRNQYFFAFTKKDELRPINFDEISFNENEFNFIGLHLSPIFDEFYIRRALLFLFPRTTIPIMLFADLNLRNNLTFITQNSGLFDGVVFDRREETEIHDYIPNNVVIL